MKTKQWGKTVFDASFQQRSFLRARLFVRVFSPFIFGLLALFPLSGKAQNYEIIKEDLEADRTGMTVLRVWGSHYEMGFALGAALAQDIHGGVEETRSYVGNYYSTLRSYMEAASWLPQEIEDEMEGIAAGVKSELSSADLDATDVKIINTYGDWGYACRSHSCWGSWVTAPFKTLSTRRLDFSAPFSAAKHHVLCAWDPDDGSVRWVNFSAPGYVAVVTGVNAYGTLVSLHDYSSTFSPSVGVVPRCVATRLVLTGMETSLPVEDQLSWAETQLSSVSVATGTFINYYIPEGRAGVFTCPPGQACGAPRQPQNAFFSGEVILTTNRQTDGTEAPSDDTFMEDYYLEGGPKDMESHYSAMGHTGLHLLTVGYRGPEDMLLWAEGKTSSGVTDRVEIEWSELFDETTIDPDGGVTPDGGVPEDGSTAADGGVSDGSQQEVDAASSGSSGDNGDGCSCHTLAPSFGSTPYKSTGLALFFLFLLAFHRRKRKTHRSYLKAQ